MMLALRPAKWVRPSRLMEMATFPFPDSPLLDSLTTSITIELWFKTDQVTSDWTGIVAKELRLAVASHARANTVDFTVSV